MNAARRGARIAGAIGGSPAPVPAAAAEAEPRVMTTAELAAFLKVSTRTIRKRKYPRLPGPGRPRYLLSDVLAFDRRSA